MKNNIKKGYAIALLGMLLPYSMFLTAECPTQQDCQQSCPLMPCASMPTVLVDNEPCMVVDVEALRPFVAAIVEPRLLDGKSYLSNGILNCYIRLQRGQKEIPVQDLIDAVPELTEELERQLDMIESRAPRPEGPNQIVGPGGCDLSAIIDLLLALEVLINDCCSDIINTVTICCENIIASLTNISINVTLTDIGIDFSGVFTSLVSINDTLTTCCATLENDFVGVFTTLNSLDFSCTAIVDLSGVFTSIADVNNTLTECCAILENDFAGVFTTLNNLNFSCTELIPCCTTIGSVGDLIPGCTNLPPEPFDYDCLPSTTDSTFVVTNYDVIQWLKAIYARLGQLSGF